MFKVIEGLRGLIWRFEFWGEFSCPIVTQGSFSQIDYTLIYGEVAKAARAANPGIQCWPGGNGVGLHVEWMRNLIDPVKIMPDTMLWYPDGMSNLIDAWNGHHYYHTRYAPEQIDDRGRLVGDDLGLDNTIAMYNAAFSDARDLSALADNQPFVSTEWGYPTIRDEDLPIGDDGKRKPLYSAAYFPGIIPVAESLAPEWFERSFECFDENDFRIVCVHTLFDTPPGGLLHWGYFCGLHGTDGRQKPQYKTVQEWCWRGRNQAQHDKAWWHFAPGRV